MRKEGDQKICFVTVCAVWAGAWYLRGFALYATAFFGIL